MVVSNVTDIVFYSNTHEAEQEYLSTILIPAQNYNIFIYATYL